MVKFFGPDSLENSRACIVLSRGRSDTNRVLRSRMDDYRDQKSSQTMRLREAISAELNDGRPVGILGWRESDEHTLIAEEKRLRARYSPPWNRI